MSASEAFGRTGFEARAAHRAEVCSEMAVVLARAVDEALRKTISAGTHRTTVRKAEAKRGKRVLAER